jgi:hypothetical protein
VSGSSAKETRRQLRRALGPDALDLLEQHDTAIQTAFKAGASLERRVGEIEARLRSPAWQRLKARFARRQRESV